MQCSNAEDLVHELFESVYSGIGGVERHVYLKLAGLCVQVVTDLDMVPEFVIKSIVRGFSKEKTRGLSRDLSASCTVKLTRGVGLVSRE